MKLSKIALSLFALSGIAGVGTSWYTGKQIEERYPLLINEANNYLNLLQSYGIQAEIKEVELERNLFSSTATYQIEAKTSTQTYQFSGSDKIFHGPFPLNRLAQFKLTPMMASVESDLSVKEAQPLLLDNNQFLTARTDINYSKETASEIKTSAKSGEFFQFEPFLVKLATQKVGEKQKIDLHLPKIQIIDKALNTLFTVENLNYQLDAGWYNNAYPMLTLGDFGLKLGHLAIEQAKPNSASEQNKTFKIVFKDVSSDGYGKMIADRYQTAADVNANVMIETNNQKIDLGKYNFDLFMDTAAAPFQQLIGLAGDPEQLRQVLETDQPHLDLLQQGLIFQLKNLVLENDKGKSNLQLDLNIDKFDANEIHSIDDILKILAQSHLSGSLDLNALEKANAQIKELNGHSQHDAAQLAKLERAELAKQAQHNDIFNVDENMVNFSLDIKDGKVIWNNSALTEEELQQALFVIMLAFSQ
ncbi:uncharacterized protein YdgA (DUF945 family) [Nicoletella semolina]|uniref:Uncharacterized protein YdgA (DUF945 family) n=1 Tax=Nicoletella semolina TaxID=271160 RepID=A0A4R2N5L4_9PAST|nr:DUF945 family protein [Nicoletella semolina]MDH2925458.1 hypothetical protein [Nicoletella semolina]TCP16091.1 uncharacterized protein YdgA (DUF945 family) [Nicoletella semolina]